MFEIDIFSSSIILSALLCLVAGLLSFLSPCVLPILPPYLAYMTGTTLSEIKSNKETLKRSVMSQSQQIMYDFSVEDIIKMGWFDDLKNKSNLNFLNILLLSPLDISRPV